MPVDAGIAGIGVDLVETDRLQECLTRWGARFKRRVFTPVEQAYCEEQAAPWLHYAGRFAVKESVAKACGSGIGAQLHWLDMRVERDAVSGAPRVEFSREARLWLARKGIVDVLVTLSHTRRYAVAQAVALRDGGANDQQGGS